jgi:hypothetical protein
VVEGVVVELKNGLFRLFDGAETAAAKVSARVVIAGLLTAHPTASGAQLRSKPALPTAHARHQTEGHQGVVSHIFPWPEQGREGGGRRVRRGSRNGAEAQIGRWREEPVAIEEDGMEILEGGVLGNGERERREGRK